jgi:hypothetical protein
VETIFLQQLLRRQQRAIYGVERGIAGLAMGAEPEMDIARGQREEKVCAMHVGQQRFAAITFFRMLARSEVGYYRDPLCRVPGSLADCLAIRSAA